MESTPKIIHICISCMKRHLIKTFLGMYPLPFYLFKRIWPELKSQFQFKPEIQESAKAAIEESTENIRSQYPNVTRFVYVGVHFRRGDYMDLAVTKDYQHDDEMWIKFFQHCMNKYRSELDTEQQKS